MLAKIIKNFSANLTALRGFVAVINPALVANQRTILAEHEDTFLALSLALKDVDAPVDISSATEERVARVRRELGCEVKVTKDTLDGKYKLELSGTMPKRLEMEQKALQHLSHSHSLALPQCID